ncbi:MAG: hypothetical protein QM724_00590 [Flavobacteriales bacterium]
MRPIAVLAVLCALHVEAQGPPAPRTIEGAFDRFTTDDLGNVYALQGDVLRLFNAEGRQLARNSLNTFGGITCIDAFSSLKPLIFSRQQGQLALLDNTLSVQGDPIDLPRAGFPQVTQVCMSVQNAFWFFDERALSLSRVDAQLRPLASTGRLDQLLGWTPHPTYLAELDGWLYVCDSEHGVLLFDLFGTYARTLPIVNARTIDVRNGAVWYIAGIDLHRYDLRTMETTSLPWPIPMDEFLVRDARIERGALYLLMPDRIVISPF